MIPLDPEEIFIIAFAAVIAVVGSIVLIRAMRSSAKYRLGRSTWPEPRDKGRGDPTAVMRLSDYQTGLIGPMDVPGGLPAYLGPHLLAVDGQRAVLRGGARQHARRFVLLAFVAVPIFLVWGATELLDVLQFMSSETARLGVDELPDGKLHSYFFDPSLAGFVQSKIHRIELILSADGSGAANIARLLTHSALSLIYFALFLVIVATIILRPTAAPIVVDRARRVVYTREGGKVWAAPLDGIAVAMAQGPFGATSLAFGLRDVDDSDSLRWHPVAAYQSWAEMFSKQRHSEGVVAADRWQAMRLWVAIFAAGYEPTRTEPAFGPTRLVAPRAAGLGDASARIDAEIAGGKLVAGPFGKTRPAPVIAGVLTGLDRLGRR